jgi:hypothetical protein
VFEGIVYVLRTGCQWKALPAERFGSASAIHKRFLEWEKAGFFEALWKAGLAEYDDMEGIAWRWQSVDGALMEAPLAQEAVGRNPTDREKKWTPSHRQVPRRMDNQDSYGCRGCSNGIGVFAVAGSGGRCAPRVTMDTPACRHRATRGHFTPVLAVFRPRQGRPT